MLKSRLILSLCLNEGQLCRTKKFRPDRFYTLNYVDMELADEILLLDVTRHGVDNGLGTSGPTGSPFLYGAVPGGLDGDFLRAVLDFSANLFLPLTVGGWITSLDDVKKAFDSGADKVVINTEAFRHPEFITQIAHKYGSQAVVVSIDVKDWHVWIDRGSEDTGVHVLEWAHEAVGRGAGELLLMDWERDGSLEGYNLELVQAVSGAVSVPVIALGGCGNWSHLVEGYMAGADACATSCIFHFTKPSLKAAKSYLHQAGVPVRI